MLNALFYGDFSAIFRKVRRLVSDSVTRDQMLTGIKPILRARIMHVSKSLDYALHSCFRKCYSIRYPAVVHHCMVFFIFLLSLKQ